MAKRKFTNFVPRPKPRKRPGRHTKNLNKHKKRSHKPYNNRRAMILQAMQTGRACGGMGLEVQSAHRKQGLILLSAKRSLPKGCSTVEEAQGAPRPNAALYNKSIDPAT